MSSESPKQPSVGELADEFLERYRRGERPALSEYTERYPEYADEIRDVFPGLAMIEDLGPELPDAGVLPPDTASELSTDQLGDFRIIREVGRGGMGVVYEAEQVSLGRRVALKVLPRQLWQDGRHARRFEREARAAARLHHTNIVPVFGVGEQDGLHYYVMQFIQGLSLDDVLSELKKLREASEAARAEGHAIGVQASACPPQPEGRIPIRDDVSALEVARSLVSGRFERTAVLESSQSGQPPAVSGQPPRSPLTPHPPTLDPPETAVGRLSDTHVSASSFTLPGQGEAHSRVQSRNIYWQSVARIGVQAAEALEYAHDQGVVHRDVKPSNLLLDTRGTIWITDFGLAKAADQQDLTHTGDVLGTLRYMAPEQFDGKADARSDVYSLGLTLYELLALQPAFGETDRYRLVKQVTHGTPDRLRTLDATIPRDLETIVHKAIDRDASHRYQSARELAEDLQRYLGDEPIRARRISPVARVRRWCKRNPAGATVAALLLVGFLSSCAAAAVFLQQAAENARLAETERELKQQAQDALAVAQRERARADENFDQAWSAVDRFYATVSQSRLLNVPGMQPLRRELLTEALDYYRQFIEQESGNPALQKELADAQLGLARISRELGLPEQREVFRDALTMYRVLSRASPDDAEIQHGLATCYFWLGSNLQAIDIWNRLLETDPENALYKRRLADALHGLAFRQDEEENYEAALVTHQRVLYLRMELLRAAPDDPQIHADLGSTLNNIGVLLARKERYEDALAMYQQSIVHDEFAFERDPGNIQFGRFFAIGSRNIAHLEERFGRSDEAERWFRRAAEVRARIASANPDVAYLQSDAYDAWRLLAEHLQAHDQPEEAADAFRRAGDVLERLPQRKPDELFNLARVYALASATGSQPEGAKDEPTPEQLAERRQLANRAVDALQRAVDAGFSEPDRLESDADLAALRGRPEFAELLERVESRSQFEEIRPVEAEASAESDERADLGAAQYSIGLLKTLFDEPDGALAALTRSAELREELLESRPYDRALRMNLAQTHRVLADLAWRNDRYVDAREHWEDLFEVLESPEAGELNTELAEASYDFGETLARFGLLNEAQPYFARRLELNPAGGLKPLRALYLAYRAQGDNAAALEVAWRAVDRLATDRQSPGTAASAVLLPLLMPEHLDDDQLQRMVRLAEQIRGRATGNPVWARRTQGLAAYRTGRFEEALQALVPSGSEPVAIQCGFLRAMAQYRLGRVEEAERELEVALRNQHQSDAGTYSFAGSGDLGAKWHMWFVADHLRKEAEMLILGAPRPQRPLISLHRGRACALLGNTECAEELFDEAVHADPEGGLYRLLRVRFLAEAGFSERAAAEFPRARELFLARREQGPETPEEWREMGLAARLCSENRVAADAFARAVEVQSDLLRASPAGDGMRTRLDGMFDELAAELIALGAEDELHAACTEQQVLYEQLAINPLTTIEGHAAPYVWSVAVLPDGRRALSAGQDGLVCLWDLTTAAEIRRYEHHGPVLRVVCLPGGDQFLTAGYDTTIRLWDIETGEVVREFRGHTDHLDALAVSADGARAVSAGDDETLRVWDVGTGNLLQSIATDGSVRCVAVSPDGRRALSGPFMAESYEVSMWDMETGERLRDFAAHESTVYCVAFSPDGARAVSGDQNGLVVLWDVPSGDELQRWEEKWGDARDATILDDGRILLATGSGALAILDVDSGRVVQRLDGNIRHYDLAILPNGRQVLTGDADATLRRWSLPLLAPPDEAAELIARQFDALAPAPEAQARLLDQMRNSVPVMDRLLELRPEEPQLQIARAKSIAEQGNWTTAATSLRSFLPPEGIVETDWWVSPNYPGDTHRRWSFFSAGDNLDPYTVHGAAEDSPWQLSWKPAAVGSDGGLTLLTSTSENRITEHSATYVLRRIYVPQPCTRLYSSKADNTTFFWLNGRLLDVANTALAVPVPVELELQPGWNTLLVKVINFADSSGLEMRRIDDMDTADSRRLLVQAAVLRGDWRLAMQRWQELTAMEGVADDLAAWKALTDIHIESSTREQQQMLLEALYAWQAGDHNAASQRYREAVAVNPRASLRHPRLADLRSTLEELLDVEQQLTEAIQQQPDSAERWRDRAQFHLRRGARDQAAADFQNAIDREPPTVLEPGWALSRTVILPWVTTAHFSPRDGAVYAGARFGDSEGAVFRIDSDGGITRLGETPGVTGLVVDHESGDVFISDSHSNLIHRFEAGTGRPELWVSSFNPADRDPMGMAFVPAGFANDRIKAGDLLVVDCGWGDDDEISAVSTRRKQQVTLLHRDGQGVGPLVHATDVSVAGDQVYLVDNGESGPGRIFRVEADCSLTPVATEEEIQAPVGVAADPLSGDLLILDMNRRGIVRVNPATGAVDNCITGIALDHQSFAGVDISPDGMQLFVTDPVAAAVFTFTRTPLGLARQAVRPLLKEGRWDEAAEQLNAALDEETEPFVVESDWWVTGPYPQIGFDASHFSPTDNLDPLQAAAGSGAGTVLPEWRAAKLDANGRLDFNNLFAGSDLEDADSYALRRIYASQEQTVLYHFDADDHMRVWVNAQPTGVVESKDIPIQIPLNRGWNTLLVKVWNAYGNYFLEADEVRREEVAPDEWNRLIHRAANVLDPRKVIEQLTADIATSPENPDLLIQRGRRYLKLREDSEADADFAAAAALTPDELNRFLEAGWWMIGPYPSELREFCPPELDPDPSRPVRVIDPQTGLSDRAVTWQSIPTAEAGRIDLSGLAGGGQQASFYALAHVYSPDERTTLLRVGRADGIRIWCNRRLVFDTAEKLPLGMQAARVPIALRAGRNELLLKIRAGAPCEVSLGDSPSSRVDTQMESGLWPEAAALFATEAHNELTTHLRRWCFLAKVLLLADDADGYIEECRRIYDTYSDTTDVWESFLLVHALTASRNPVWDEHAPELKSFIENFGQHEISARMQPYFRALCALQEGHYTVAKHILEQTGVGQKASLLAIIAHVEGDATAAANWLADAQERDCELLCDRTHFESRWWPDVVRHAITFRDAERLITGRTTASDAHLATLHNDALSRTANADPETAAFDHLIETFPITNEHQPTFRWLARGARLAERGRFDKAEADFNKAVELAPEDTDVLVARARFEAERGNLSEASAAFQTALQLAESVKSTQPQAWEFVEREIGLQEALLDDWLARAPNNARLWRVRAQRQFQLGKWREAAESLEHGRHDSHELLLAILYCLLGDGDAYSEACRNHAEVIPDDYDEWFQDYLRLYVLGLQSATGEELAQLTQRMEARLLDPPRSRWERVPLGVALYRHGRYNEALRVLNEALSPQRKWQGDARVWPLLAMTHWQLGHHDEARKWLERSSWWIDLAARAVNVRHAIGPDNIGYAEWLCSHLFHREAQGLIGEDPAVVKDRAERAREQQRWDEAAREYEALADIYRRQADTAPDEPAHLVQLAAVCDTLQGMYSEAGDTQRALAARLRSVAACESLVAKHPGELSYANQLAYKRYQSGTELQSTDQEAAQEHFTSGLRLVTEVIDSLNDRTDLRGELANACFYRGVIRDKLDDDAAAKEDLIRAVELAPDQTWFRRELAWFLALTGDPEVRDPETALQHAQRAVELEPENRFNQDVLAYTGFLAGDPQTTVDAQEKSFALGSIPRPYDCFRLAISYADLERPDEARPWYDRGVQLMEEPDDVPDWLQHLQERAATALGIESES